MKKKFLRLSVIFFLSFFLFFLFRPGIKTIRRGRIIMGTVVNLTVLDSSARKADRAAEEAFREMERLEDLFSVREETSQVARWNREGEITGLADELYEVISRGLMVSRLSDGAFDFTVYPLLAVWAEAGKEKEIPSPEEIRRALSLVDYRGVILDGSRGARFVRKGMAADLGGIAKGYAVDRAAEILRLNGAENFLIEAGGDLYASGPGPRGRGWLIGLRHPREEGLAASFYCRDMAVATSGDYERFFLKEGKRYHHIIDPSDGFPADKGLLSVTVISPSASLADALATAVFVLGKKEGIELLENFPGSELILISPEENEIKIFLPRAMKIKTIGKIPSAFLNR